MMKKLLALVLSLMLLVGGCAFGEAEDANLYEGAWVQFEDGFSIYLPADWLAAEEIPEEIAAKGIFYLATSPDAVNTMSIMWTALENPTTIEEAQATLATAYEDATLIETETAQMVFYTDTANNTLNFMLMDPVEQGMYVVTFNPVSDELALTAGMITATICFVPVEEAAAE